MRVFRDLSGEVAMGKTLAGRKAQENSLTFKDHLLQAQGLHIPTRKRGRNARSAWMNKERTDRHKPKGRSKDR